MAVCSVIDPVSAVSTAPMAIRSAPESVGVASRIERFACSVAVLPVAVTLPTRMSAAVSLVERSTAPVVITLVARIEPTEETVTGPVPVIERSSSPAVAPVPTSRIVIALLAWSVVAESTATSISRTIWPEEEESVRFLATMSAVPASATSSTMSP